MTCGVGNQIVIFLRRELKYGATDSQSREANSEEASQSRKRLLTPCTSLTMLKEMIVLVIVLWGTQGMPTTPPPEQDFQGLSELYCKAERLFQDYKSVDKKHLSSEARSKMKTEFSQPNCNFTKSADKCQTIWEFKELFVWLKDIHQQDELLKPVMGSFLLLIDHQNNYVNNSCSERASDKTPEFNCPKYSKEDEGPSRENMFHYIFELYKTLMHNLLSPKNRSEVCKTTGN